MPVRVFGYLIFNSIEFYDFSSVLVSMTFQITSFLQLSWNVIKHCLKCMIFNFEQNDLEPKRERNKPFAGSGHMVRNKLCWDANNVVGLSKQRNSHPRVPNALFASQHNLFRTMWADHAKNLLINFLPRRAKILTWRPLWTRGLNRRGTLWCSLMKTSSKPETALRN